jgi:hypothetical protein
MKTYTELGTAIGELVDEKNAAYGNSVATSGQFLALLFPDGLQPVQYSHALLLVRIFDKLQRIATDADTLGESPYQDIAGYGILGAHMQWQQKEERATWQGNANGSDVNQPAKGQPDSAAPSISVKTTTNESEMIAQPPSQQPDGCSAMPASAAASTAPENASPSEDERQRAALRARLAQSFPAWRSRNDRIQCGACLKGCYGKLMWSITVDSDLFGFCSEECKDLALRSLNALPAEAE